jgi:DNA-binding transcriptional regulator YdaS (Cro superfamily)
MHELERWITRCAMNKAQAARLFGVSWPTLHRWLNGRTPQPKHMRNIIRKTKGEVTADAWFPKPKRS